MALESKVESIGNTKLGELRVEDQFKVTVSYPGIKSWHRALWDSDSRTIEINDEIDSSAQY